APDNTLAQRALTTFYLATGRVNDAKTPLKLMADTVKTAEGRIALADLYQSIDSTDEAVTLLKAVAQSEKGTDLFGEATVRLASIDYMHKRLDEASSEVDAVLAVQPTHV